MSAPTLPRIVMDPASGQASQSDAVAGNGWLVARKKIIFYPKLATFNLPQPAKLAKPHYGQ
jgi:hypothetical protein